MSSPMGRRGGGPAVASRADFETGLRGLRPQLIARRRYFILVPTH